MKDGKAKRHLEEKRQRLQSQIEATEKLLDQARQELGSELVRVLKKAGIRIPAVPGGDLHFDVKGAQALTGSELELFSVFRDLIFNQARDCYELEEIDLLLRPRKGRPPEEIYEHAQREREANPQLTPEELAEKYLPEYFPHRARHAVDMMDQGLRRQRRRARPTK